MIVIYEYHHEFGKKEVWYCDRILFDWNTVQLIKNNKVFMTLASMIGTTLEIKP